MDPSADITRFRTRNLNWIERSRLFCYSVINFLYWTSFSSFAFELQKLLYFIISSCVCQELFFFFCSIKTFKRNRSYFRSKALFSEATHLYYHTAILLSRTFFDFFNCFFKRNNSSLQLVYITMRYSLCQANFSNILSFLFCNKKAVNTSISSCFLPESISCYRNKISQ